MGARSGGGGSGGFGSAYRNLPKGGFSKAPFSGAVKVGSLKDGEILTNQNGQKFRISIAKSSKNQVVIGSSMVGSEGYGTSWAVVNKNAYVNGRRI